MIIRPMLSLLLIAPTVPAMAGPTDRRTGVELAQLTIRQRVIVRVPRLPDRRAPLPVPTKWKEKGGPKCVSAGEMAGALVTQPDAVDLVMIGGQRLRAKLEGNCRPLDFYSGFYLRPAPDGKVCADRDSIRARSGATCPITKFKTLKPEKAKR